MRKGLKRSKAESPLPNSDIVEEFSTNNNYNNKNRKKNNNHSDDNNYDSDIFQDIFPRHPYDEYHDGIPKKSSHFRIGTKPKKKIVWTRDSCNPDVVTFDDDVITARAVMTCGHAISPKSLRSFVENEIRIGKIKFICPGQSISGNCDHSIPLTWIAEVCAFAENETKSYEKKMTENRLNNSPNFVQCPRCQIWIDKKCIPICNKVTCPNCSSGSGSRRSSSNQNEKFEFCRKCSTEWDLYTDNDDDDVDRSGNNPSSVKDNNNKVCLNPSCPTWSTLDVLENCETITINGEACPTFRACPNCETLIRHKGQCNHVNCSKCETGFCFVCLKVRQGKKWHCDYSLRCLAAPLQNLGIQNDQRLRSANVKKRNKIVSLTDLPDEMTIFGLLSATCLYFLHYFECQSLGLKLVFAPIFMWAVKFLLENERNKS
ncbi:hypothetical protein HELRODRAFT_161901 [Helobdella robusta]|uniref:RING-type domain-containing protein n=1 Tax=Helobdella robusta TaxID=6412 RepID=T1ES08_HELRO|nr:hypothetical protein HELRODRAFT_161901 [Helobdella robusta]ESO02612.1 hypothetical protein HELRODRAFT_161901 [Helobdella robusta]